MKEIKIPHMAMSVGLLSLHFCNVLCHVVGVSALATTYNKSSQKHLFLYLINYSICQVCMYYMIFTHQDGVFRANSIRDMDPNSSVGRALNPKTLDLREQKKKKKIYTFTIGHI